MKKILLVEDSEESELLVKELLGRQYSITSVPFISKALEILKSETFDLILLDVMLPDGSGFNLCSELRKSRNTASIPIIFVTGRNDTPDKVLGFALGADDYVVKPFDPPELQARVEAKLRKADEILAGGRIEKGKLSIDLSTQKAFLMSKKAPTDLGLTPIEFKLLHYFIRHDGQVISRPQLLSAIWGDQTHVVHRAIDRHVSALRAKLPQDSLYSIEAIYGSGYVLSPIKSETASG